MRKVDADPVAGLWYRVRRYHLRAADDERPARLTYELEPASHSPIDLVDSRGRHLVEAFTALPIDAIEREAQAKGQPAPESTGLVDLILRFGPIGVFWETQHPVAERVDGELHATDRIVELWAANVSARVWAIEQTAPHAPGDDLPGIAWAWRHIWRLISLADAVAMADPMQAKAAWGATWVDPAAAGALSDRWNRALIGRRPPGKELRPWLHPTRFNWRTLAQLRLAEELSSGLRFAQPLVITSVDGHLRQSWKVRSLVEARHVQILEQVTGRPEGGIGRCTMCGGAVLRTRRALGPRANRWHPGCKAAGLKRAQRHETR